jgi:predicted peptidase
LPEDLAKKIISLNPEYAVYGKDTVKKDDKLPLVISLHGGGGTGNQIRKVARHPHGFLQTIQKAGEKCLCVVPQALKSPREHHCLFHLRQRPRRAQSGWTNPGINRRTSRSQT